jgi:hypothetical protein
MFHQPAGGSSVFAIAADSGSSAAREAVELLVPAVQIDVSTP